MIKSNEQDLFWTTLRSFWSIERITRWQAAIFTERRTEVCENLMTMCPNAHAYWGKAYFALKPILLSDDHKKLQVKFYWLRKYEPPAAPPAAPAPAPPARPAPPRGLVVVNDVPNLPNNLRGVNNVKLLDVKSDKVIRSGKMIEFTTDDPVKNPLPSKDILDMQWALHRLTAISGGAGVVNYKYNPDDPDDYHPYPVLDNKEWPDEWDLDEVSHVLKPFHV